MQGRNITNQRHIPHEATEDFRKQILELHIPLRKPPSFWVALQVH